ncbi:MAG TPA: ribonuclease PH [Planctomycetaceae bacterium]|nr:ribonuclease PH [Planctomycetaceae bacterium]
MRADGRSADDLRPVVLRRSFTAAAPGSVLYQAGRTIVLCTASIDEGVPPWKLKDENPSGWVTAEYSMLPGSTAPRKKRERGQIDGRSQEIQRLVGRSLRAAVDLAALGPRTITVDCDVLQADGGTRTASITGGFVALVDAVSSIREKLTGERPVFVNSVAAISVGIIEGSVLVDLDYSEDVRADVDFNVVMTGNDEFIEVQGTAEGRTFGPALLERQLDAARKAIARLTALQRNALGEKWPLDSFGTTC